MSRTKSFALLFVLAGTIPVLAENNTVGSYSKGVTANLGKSFIVGRNGTNNVLYISGGAQVSDGSACVGSGGSATDNGVYVADAGTRWASSADLTIGRGGSQNFVSVAGGAAVTADTVTLGESKGADQNSLSIAGNGSLVRAAGALTIGVKGVGSTLTADASARVECGSLAVGSGSVAINCALEVFGGSVVACGGAAQVSGGRLTLDSGSVQASSLAVASRGVLEGAGQVAAPVSVAGTLRPGRPVGTLLIGSDLALAATSVYQTEITAAGLDQVVAAGSVKLAGTLQVLLPDGLQPAANDSFLILSAANISGSFSQVTCPQCPAGLTATAVVQGGNLFVVFK